MDNAERLRTIRKARGYSLRGMAEKVGMAPSGYIRLEDGSGGQAFAKLPVIAKALGCHIDDLFPEMDNYDPDDPEIVMPPTDPMAYGDPPALAVPEEPDDDEIPF